MNLRERIERLERYEPYVESKWDPEYASAEMSPNEEGDWVRLTDVISVIREDEQVKNDFSEFGGFDPDRPWVNEWAKWRGVHKDGTEWESSEKLYVIKENGWFWVNICDYNPYFEYRVVKDKIDMTGKDWTKSLQERK